MAFIRAHMFFCFWFIVSYLTGVVDKVFFTGDITNYVNDLGWQIYTAVNFIYVFIGYWFIWPAGTVTYNRQRFYPTILWFGVLNGINESMFNLAIWAVCELFGKREKHEARDGLVWFSM